VLARVEGGRLAEVWFLPEDQATFDAFFTDAGTPPVMEPAASSQAPATDSATATAAATP
jgi:hypothetical protein